MYRPFRPLHRKLSFCSFQTAEFSNCVFCCFRFFGLFLLLVPLDLFLYCLCLFFILFSGFGSPSVQTYRSPTVSIRQDWDRPAKQKKDDQCYPKKQSFYNCSRPEDLVLRLREGTRGQTRLILKGFLRPVTRMFVIISKTHPLLASCFCCLFCSFVRLVRELSLVQCLLVSQRFLESQHFRMTLQQPTVKSCNPNEGHCRGGPDPAVGYFATPGCSTS